MTKQENLEKIASQFDEAKRKVLSALIDGLSHKEIKERNAAVTVLTKDFVSALEDDPDPRSRQLSLETLKVLSDNLRAPQSERELNDLNNAAFFYVRRRLKHLEQKATPRPPQPTTQSVTAKLQSFFRTIFQPKPKPKTILERAQEASGKLIVGGYRRIFAQGGIGASNEMSDQFILETYQRVATAFHDVSVERGELLEAGSKNKIVLKFLELHRTKGAAFFEEHLAYELQKYRTQGLRPEYASPPLHLF